jgi:hypothetical protein
MSPTRADVWVSLRPCGCRHTLVPGDSLATMKARLTEGWSLHRLAPSVAAMLPTACDICAPVRQEQLF